MALALALALALAFEKMKVNASFLVVMGVFVGKRNILCLSIWLVQSFDGDLGKTHIA